MGLKEEVMEVRNELEEVKQESFAMELLKDARKTNKRQFIIILVILGLWFATIGYLVYVLNDISVITDEYTQEISDIDAIENSNIVNGGAN